MAFEPSNWQYLGLLIPLAGMSIPIIAIVTEHRRKEKAMEVLREYAQRGEEPPPSVMEALKQQSGNMVEMRKAAEGQVTGPAALPKFAFFLVMSLGFSALVYFFYRGGPAQNWFFIVGFGIPAFVMLALSMQNLARSFVPPAKTDGQ